MTHDIKKAFLAIDEGTTSTRVIAFDEAGKPIVQHGKAISQHYPKAGWVEHDADEICDLTIQCLKALLKDMEGIAAPVSLGITNQRETVVFWDKKSGKALAPAIVWQDRRTAAFCDSLRRAGHEKFVQEKTGLLLDPYFTASKLNWLLENNPEIAARAKDGSIAAGTMESYLLYRLTGQHLSDITNASRTLLFDIHKNKWSDDLLELFEIPKTILPEVCMNTGNFGQLKTGDTALDSLVVTAMIGDQQSAAIGQGCLVEGMTKATYGTGCFMLINTGKKALPSHHRLLTTIAYDVGDGPSYAIEGSIFMAGSAIKWLKDGMGLIQSSAETETMAESLSDNRGVYVVPAFAGLGAPHWDAEARGAIFGLTQDTGGVEIARAVLESVAYQTLDLIDAAVKDGTPRPNVLRIDGGMAANDWFVSFLSDILDVPVDRPQVTETTALGAAFLGALGAKHYNRVEDVQSLWALDKRFKPSMSHDIRTGLLEGWQDAVSRTLSQPRKGH